MKLINLQILLAISFLFVSVSSRADEIGPATCGHAIEIHGTVNHYSLGEDYLVANATDKAMYEQEIYGKSFETVIKELPAGSYTLELYMAESYHQSSGQRIFSIFCNDEVVSADLDIFTLVGKDTEYKISYQQNYDPASMNNEFVVRFETSKDNAKFNAIQLLDSTGTLVACGMASEFASVIEPTGNGNPFIQHMYTADPSAHIFEDRVYVYPSHDQLNANGFNMRDYHVFSSSDLKNWEDHGVVLDVDDVPWASEYMWAPDCAYRDGTYYFYFPAKDQAGDFRIGVATGDSPAGPFVPEAEPIPGSFSVDPSVFIDDDGQAYMYFGGDGHGGQSNPWVARLNDDMKSFKEAPVKLTGISYWFEACWVHKLDEVYYLSYSTGQKHPNYPNSSAIAWATSDSPLGPFQYKGIVNGYVSGWTNHHSTLEYKGQWYFFYHNSDLSGGETSKRSICADYLHFNEDGSIQKVKQTNRGIGSYDGLARMEAENYSACEGPRKSEVQAGGLCVEMEDGDTLWFNNVDFGEEELNLLEFLVATNVAGGNLELHSDSLGLLTDFPVMNTGGLQTWSQEKSLLAEFKGVHDLYLVYKANPDSKLMIDWLEFSFTLDTDGETGEIASMIRIYPNPSSPGDPLIIEGAQEGTQLRLYDLTGRLILEGEITIGKQILTSPPSSGMYLYTLLNEKEYALETGKLIVQ
ncbi:MAG: family 43 glycosylhydrolase [Bacteroides sp.]|nr:family 43 glycosylhydrolase [Bacteroides sp.]